MHAQSQLSPCRLSRQTRMFPSLDIISPFCPQLTKHYPNMNLELQGRVVSAPILNFSPGNLSLAPEMEIEGFVLLPNSAKEFIFQLGVVRFAFVNVVPFSRVLSPHLRQSSSFRFQLDYHFLKEAFLNIYN